MHTSSVSPKHIQTSHMPESVVLDMPTDLRSTNARVSPFELQEAIGNKKNHRGVTALTTDIPDASKIQRSDTPRPPPLWRTPEFFFYYLVAAVVIPFMVWVPINMSSRASQTYYHALFVLICKSLVATHANYAFFHYKLSSGWLFGRQVVSTFIHWSTDTFSLYVVQRASRITVTLNIAPFETTYLRWPFWSSYTLH